MKKHTFSFQTKLLITLCTSLFAVGLAMIGTVAIISETYRNNDVIKTIKARHNAVDESLNSIIDDTNFALINLFTESNFSTISSSNDPEETFQVLFKEQSIPSNLFSGINYTSENYHFLATTDTSINLPELPVSTYQTLKNGDETSYPIHYCLSTYNDTGSFVVLAKKISLSNDDGVCFVYLNESRLMSIVDSIVCLENNYVIDSKKTIVLSSNPEELGAVIFNGNELGISNSSSYKRVTFQDQDVFASLDSLSSTKNSFAFDWQVLSFQDYDELFGWVRITMIILISLSAIAFVGVILFSVFFSHKISKPIKALAEEVQQFPNVDSPKLKPEGYQGNDEIGQLEYSYQEMVNRIHELMEENLRKVNQQRILELESLQMQINPHFLYNTLDTISWIAKINKQPEIDSLVMSLAKFFRLTLHSGDKIITVKEELEITQHYLEIQKARFPDRFDFNFDIDHSLDSERTLKLILQPVVENSVKYAFDPEKGRTQLSITTRREGNDFVYEVIDNGVGFEVPNNLFERKKSNPGAKSTGFGLYNVQERIKLEYGKNYGLKVTSILHQGTKVKITLPLLSEGRSPSSYPKQYD